MDIEHAILWAPRVRPPQQKIPPPERDGMTKIPRGTTHVAPTLSGPPRSDNGACRPALLTWHAPVPPGTRASSQVPVGSGRMLRGEFAGLSTPGFQLPPFSIVPYPLLLPIDALVYFCQVRYLKASTGADARQGDRRTVASFRPCTPSAYLLSCYRPGGR
jgi:hypothetical protein